MADSEQRIALLLGDPVGHSLSPLIHNTAFRAMGFSALYLATRVPSQSLAAAVSGLRDPQILGANVTIPHKSAVIPFLDGLTSVADAIGAVNTIVRHEDGSLIGHNTDVEGFLAPLDTASLAGLSATILGNGGAARAVVYGLLQKTDLQQISVIGRSEDNIQRFIGKMQPFNPDRRVTGHTFDTAGDIMGQSDLIVNTTPVGMHPDVDHTPWPRPETFRANQLVYDLVYTPQKTRFLQEAEIHGATPIDGLHMLVAQAAATFRLWTRQPFPEVEVMQALNDIIS